MNPTKYINILNPKGVMVEIDEVRLPELLKKGYLKLDSNLGTQRFMGKDVLEVIEV